MYLQIQATHRTADKDGVCADLPYSFPPRVRDLRNCVISKSNRVSRVEEDRQLVDRCLSGESAAWDELYHGFHNGLVATVRLLLGPSEWDINLIDEIVARIWYALVSRDGELLGRFDVRRGCRLSTYLAQLARSEISSFFRSERRRRNRERIASRLGHETAENEIAAEFEEFFRTLTPREMEFCAAVLLGGDPAAAESFTATNAWKLQSRIRKKLRHFFSECDSSAALR